MWIKCTCRVQKKILLAVPLESLFQYFSSFWPLPLHVINPENPFWKIQNASICLWNSIGMNWISREWGFIGWCQENDFPMYGGLSCLLFVSLAFCPSSFGNRPIFRESHHSPPFSPRSFYLLACADVTWFKYHDSNNEDPRGGHVTQFIQLNPVLRVWSGL